MARKMKDSGIEWIGEIPEGWEVVKAKYLFAQRNEKGNSALVLLSPTQKYGVIPQSQLEGVVQVKESTDLRGFKTIHIGDFVISLRSFQGGFEFSNYEGVCSPAYQVFHATKDLSNDFFRYLFKSDGFISKINSLTVGIREGKNIQYWDFSNMLLAVPPKEIQIRSAQYLNAKCTEIDTMLSKTRSSIEEYKKLKQAVITQAVTKGVHDERETKGSGVEWIGEIPKEWAVSPMKHFIDILPGYAFSSDDFCIEEGIPLLRGINVGVNEIRWDETVRWNHSISKQLESFFLKENDLVVGLDRPWISDGTRVAFITKKDLPCLLLQRVCRIRTRCNFDIRWIYYWLSGSSFKDSLSTETTGISVPHISTKQIEQFIVAFPNQLEQTQICNYLDAKCAEIDGLIAKKEQLVKELENYKKSLIYEVVTGKREV